MGAVGLGEPLLARPCGLGARAPRTERELEPSLGALPGPGAASVEPGAKACPATAVAQGQAGETNPLGTEPGHEGRLLGEVTLELGFTE